MDMLHRGLMEIAACLKSRMLWSCDRGPSHLAFTSAAAAASWLVWPLAAPLLLLLLLDAEGPPAASSATNLRMAAWMTCEGSDPAQLRGAPQAGPSLCMHSTEHHGR